MRDAHSNRQSELFQIFLFYGSSIEIDDFPLPRKRGDNWILFHEESPKNIPFIMFQPAISLFNYTATFSRHSNFPLTLHYLNNLEEITSRKYLKSIAKKNQLQRDETLAPVLYLQSICSTFSYRDEYVRELGKFIPIDSFGKCLKNRTFRNPRLRKDYLDTIFSDEFYNFISRYKFMIAYENGVCDDYVTEKFWRTLHVGVVPIYFGSPSISVETKIFA